MWQQNRELQAELDRQRAETEAANKRAEQTRLQPTQTPPPTPTPAGPTPPPPAPPTPPVTNVGGQPAVEDKPSGTVTVSLPSDVFFVSGSNSIPKPAQASLDKVAAALKKDYAGKQLIVEGHTDTDPIRKSKWKDNQQLSEARAAAVRDYLVKKGIDVGMISTRGYGADKPKGSDKSRNRRVEIVVLVDANAPNAPKPAVEKPTLNK
jgi:outer membrane protein OmpA-like peptidoglycan-associated protein